uniref:Uncharacterized protein n=1 Tax=Candidatus Kentrum sp. TUN TaxID=2126343 RepID=A0A450ZEP6_9GAMM|nr:MAG: hypothetical protein BECKTUN1418F_GA0071002_100611 [Candidatus Kentron sp. TUN]VFK52447.1 MAG: hypothetical protein BECKTUN1418E_GA0071001_100810 [Candidatus Kentron sp. TUN]
MHGEFLASHQVSRNVRNDSWIICLFPARFPMVLFSPLHGKSLTKRSKNLLAFHLRYRKNKNAEKIGVRLKNTPCQPWREALTCSSLRVMNLVPW